MKKLIRIGLVNLLALAIAATLALPTFAPPPPWAGGGPPAEPTFELVVVDGAGDYTSGAAYPPLPTIVLECGGESYVDIDNWFYVSNPSNDFSAPLPARQPADVVEVHNLTLDLTNSTGYTIEYLFEPDSPPYEYRWDPTVNPQEESLVYFVGWRWNCDPENFDTWMYEYTLTATFRDTTYYLTEDFEVEITA